MLEKSRKLYCVHIPATKNVGDACSAPYLYVPELSQRFEIKVISIAHHDKLRAMEPGAPVILGGGGLLASKPHWDESIEIALERSGKVVAWGVGLNRHPNLAKKEPLRLPSFAPKFSLFGIRDVVPGVRWVPCVSCLSPEFDQPRAETKAKVGLYLHVDRADRLPPSLQGLMETCPVMTNGGQSLAEVIRFLDSCENIITNSFHGMYWSTLLGKKVLLFDVFSEKFWLSKWTHPRYVREIDLDQQLAAAPLYPQALAEAREANMAFRDDVLQFLG